VTGFSATRAWDDGRDVPDTAQCVLEYPKGLRAVLQATLASSAGGDYVLFQGDNSSLMMMETRGWLIKEADSPLLGWEVYARKEPVLADTGIAMVADSTKLLEAGKEPGQEGPLEPEQTPLQLALQGFCSSIRLKTPCLCGAAESFRSTAIALLSNEAARTGTRLAIEPGSLEVS
jgi:predicted dehydrogenase